MLAVLQEDGGDGRPELGGGRVALVDEPEDLGADAVVEPRDHIGVVLEPQGVVGERRSSDVREQAGLAEGDLEQRPPLEKLGGLRLRMTGTCWVMWTAARCDGAGAIAAEGPPELRTSALVREAAARADGVRSSVRLGVAAPAAAAAKAP